MMQIASKFWAGLVALVFPDPARPVEWVSLGFLAGWAWFLAVTPEVLNRDSYSGFNALPASVWVAIMALVALIELAAMPSRLGDLRLPLRFAAMLLSTGIWTVVAISFELSPVPTTGIVGYSVLASVTGLTAIYLGGLTTWRRS